MSKLAINGGRPVRKQKFPPHRVIGEEEKKAACRVIDSGVLSRYLGCWHDDFYGGPEVQALEKEWASYFGAKHAISVNSCTSGLYCAVGAIGTEPGEEIIVSPYTMSASASAALIYHAIPVFADIEEDYFCLDPVSIESKITPRTRGIIIVDIFGQPHACEEVRKIARKHGLYVIEDCAQAPGASYKGKYAGTLSDIGVFSLNYHKHIHCGEGGIVVTDSDELADKVRLIRNHAECVVEDMGRKDLVNMVGFNYRMTEIEAAISRCQLKKLKKLLERRLSNCAYIEEKLKDIPAISPAKVRTGCVHAYYVHPFKFNEGIAGLPRDRFIDAVRAELPETGFREGHGPLLSCGYVKPLYLQALYRKKIAFGSKGYPFKAPYYKGKVEYGRGLCPVTERMYERELFHHEFMLPSMSKSDIDDVIAAFYKVWENRKDISAR